MPITLDGTNGITTPTYGGVDTSEYFVPVTQFKNRIINGAMTIDQRNAGASVTVNDTGAYTLDRWAAVDLTDGSLTIQQLSDAPTGFVNSIRATVASADTSLGAGQWAAIRQAIEGFNVADLNWGTANAKTVTLSFWAKSSLTGTFGGSLMNGAQNRGYPFSYTISAANTWEYKTVTIAGDTTGTWLTNNGAGIWLTFGLGSNSSNLGTAGSWAAGAFYGSTGSVSVIGTLNATFQITGVQLEVGSTATSWDARSYGTELALCQRYFQLAGGAASGSFDGSTTTIQITEKLLVTMRASPTASIQPNGYAGFRSSANDFNAASPGLANFSSSTSTSFWTQVTGFTGGTSNAVVTGRNNNANNNFIALSAEL